MPADGFGTAPQLSCGFPATPPLTGHLTDAAGDDLARESVSRSFTGRELEMTMSMAGNASRAAADPR
ncbi:hypothetical protein [Dactylosporangium darangshiense]|uniref:hypothetical protein n=1 Tax=Dactylosporangium darangshiense TaxID=579108 RepID=UPI0031E63ADD